LTRRRFAAQDFERRHLGGTGIAAAVDHLDPDQVKALAQRIQTKHFLGDGLRDLLDPRLRRQT